MSGLDAGRLRHRIRFEAPVITRGAGGSQDLSWTLFATVWAAIEPLSARELIAAAQTQSNVIARIVIRYRADLLPEMRINHNGRIYNPAGYLPDKDSGLEYLTIPVTSGLNDGS
jgi:SPP1 family predicted phage head-tail adaptor